MNYTTQSYGSYNPYYQQSYSYGIPSPYAQSFIPSQSAQQVPTQTQPTAPTVPQHDFIGNFVKSYDDVRNVNPDQTMVFLDRENDKIYIKRINEKGTPETSVFGLAEVDDTMKKPEAEKKVENISVDEKINEAINKMSEEINKKFAELEKKIKPIAMINK